MKKLRGYINGLVVTCFRSGISIVFFNVYFVEIR